MFWLPHSLRVCLLSHLEMRNLVLILPPLSVLDQSYLLIHIPIAFFLTPSLPLLDASINGPICLLIFSLITPSSLVHLQFCCFFNFKD